MSINKNRITNIKNKVDINKEISKIFDENKNYLNILKDIANNYFLEIEWKNFNWNEETIKEEFTAWACFSFAIELNNYLKNKWIDSNIVLSLDQDYENKETNLIHAYVRVWDNNYDINWKMSNYYLKNEFHDISEFDLDIWIIKNEISYSYKKIIKNEWLTEIDLDFCLKQNWSDERNRYFIKKWLDWINMN